MKKFNFKLAGLLKIRKFKEEQIKVELGNIVQKVIREKDKIIQLKNEINECY